MIDRKEFVVGFRGELTPEAEDALSRAGFRVHRDGIQASAAWLGDPSTATELRSRHVVTHVDAPDAQSALQRIVEIIGHEPDDPIVAPSSSDS